MPIISNPLTIVQESGNKLSQLVDGSITEITENDLFGITEIRESAFSECANLVSVVIPNGVTQIGGFAFSVCNALTKVIIPNGVTRIGAYAFQSCGNLKELTIPATVTLINAGALFFGGMSETDFDTVTIIMEATVPPEIGTGVFLKQALKKIIVPTGCKAVYISATNWSEYAEYITEKAEYQEIANDYDETAIVSSYTTEINTYGETAITNYMEA